MSAPVKKPAAVPEKRPSKVFPSPNTLLPSTNTRPKSIGCLLARKRTTTTGVAFETYAGKINASPRMKD